MRGLSEEYTYHDRGGCVLSDDVVVPDNGLTRAVAAGAPVPPLKFGRNNAFQTALRQRVDEYFATTGKSPRDNLQMYLKTAAILAVFIACYVMLVFYTTPWWLAFPLAILLGLAVAGIGFNVQHDGSHQAYSRHNAINKIMAMTLDIIGGSSYLWHYRHVLYHHTYVNITDEDTDIDLGILARLTPYQKRHAFQRWQHFYVWPLYGLMAINWHLRGDFWEVLTGRIGAHKCPRPRGWNLFIFIAGKLLFLTLAFVIPSFFHPFPIVLLFYAVAALTMGIVMSIVFQLAHAVEAAEFPMPIDGTTEMEHAWAVHQAETTVDFARRSSIVAWLLGGLNFQIEHHLLPKICHIHFPALSRIVEQTCREFGVKYREHATFRAGLASHFRWLRRMGMRTALPVPA
jgi:linoleoyl-CoA desaturase